MEKGETLQEYYRRTKRQVPQDLLCNSDGIRHFNLLKRKNCCVSVPFQRTDYYKITLFWDSARVHTPSGVTEINQPCIIFSNPEIKYGWESLGGSSEGYICLFSEAFLSKDLKVGFSKLSSLFKGNNEPFLLLSEEDFLLFMQYFKLMEIEYHRISDYKNEVLNNLLQLVAHHSVKIRQSQIPISENEEPRHRLVSRFFQLLDDQFPVESPLNAIPNKSASDFARQLFVHINYLNHVLKEHTGKSTTQLINERMVMEAQDLLRNTDWTIAQIAGSLGFEYPQHFSLFFKKQFGVSPRTLRLELTG